MTKCQAPINFELLHQQTLGGVSGPTSRAGQFTPEELDAMRKRAKAHAAKVKASKL